jgi:hypothetical protein
VSAEPEFIVTPEGARAWIAHLCHEARYFAVIPPGEWITPEDVRGLHAECERVLASGGGRFSRSLWP